MQIEKKLSMRNLCLELFVIINIVWLTTPMAADDEVYVKLNQYVDNLDSAQLHFFWTTGRSVSDNEEFEPIRRVAIGGSAYEEIFFTKVTELLTHSPDTVSVVLVCDDLTKAANSEQLQKLSALFDKRFIVVPIAVVIDNLLSNFSQHGATIEKVFANATRGDPVLASDIYRLVGMPFIQQGVLFEGLRQYTYVDIDTFCHGMEKDPKSLFRALFEPLETDTHDIAKRESNNDVIKITIKDIASFRKLCDVILRRIYDRPNDIITYFTELHRIIKKFEINEIEAIEEFYRFQPLYQKGKMSYKARVMHATGPYFADCVIRNRDLTCPAIWAGAWRNLDEDLDDRFASAEGACLDWRDSFSLEDELSSQFVREAQEYRRFILPALYAARFGKKHPFNKFVAQHLVERFPYTQDIFKSILKFNYELQAGRICRFIIDCEFQKDDVQIRYPDDDYAFGILNVETKGERAGKYVWRKNRDESLEGHLDLSQWGEKGYQISLEKIWPIVAACPEFKVKKLVPNVVYISKNGEELKYRVQRKNADIFTGVLPIHLDIFFPTCVKLPHNAANPSFDGIGIST